MAERTHIPGSPACGQWETLLADALDGLLPREEEQTFSGHMAGCAACAALFEESRRGREWLEYLSAEPEVPEGLLDRILAQSGPGHRLAGVGAVALPAGSPAAWQRPGLMGHLRRWAEPRLMMTAATAFFSIALSLNLAGIRLTQIRLADLRPTAIRSYMERQFTMASVPIIRYYDHLRLVYEVQSRIRELQGQNDEGLPPQNAQPTPGESRKDGKDGGSRMSPPQQSVQPAPADPDFHDALLNLYPGAPGSSLDETGNSRTTMGARERSRVWTA